MINKFFKNSFKTRFNSFRSFSVSQCLTLRMNAYYIPHPAKMETGGEDANFILNRDDNCLGFGVADGVGGYSLQGIDAGFYSRFLMQTVSEVLDKNNELKPVEMLDKAYRKLQSRHVQGGCTAVICTFNGNKLNVASLGDSGVVVFRKNEENVWEVVKKTIPRQHFFNCPFQLGGNDTPYDSEIFEFSLKESDVLICATDGLFDNVYSEEIGSMIGEHEDNMELLSCELTLKAIAIGKDQNVNRSTPFADEAKKHQVTYFGGKLDDVTCLTGKCFAR